MPSNPDAPEGTAGKPRNMTVRVFNSMADHEAADADYWKSLSPQERLELVWQLSEELWRMKGEYNDDPGLCRTVARIIRKPK